MASTAVRSIQCSLCGPSRSLLGVAEDKPLFGWRRGAKKQVCKLRMPRSAPKPVKVECHLISGIALRGPEEAETESRLKAALLRIAPSLDPGDGGPLEEKYSLVRDLYRELWDSHVVIKVETKEQEVGVVNRPSLKRTREEVEGEQSGPEEVEGEEIMSI